MKQESIGKFSGIFRVDYSGVLRRFPAEFIGFFGGCIGDKIVDDFKGSPQRLSREIYREI